MNSDSTLEDSSVTMNSNDTTIDSSRTSTDKYVPVSLNTVKPYVDFSEYNRLVEEARQDGSLPEGIEF